MHWN